MQMFVRAWDNTHLHVFCLSPLRGLEALMAVALKTPRAETRKYRVSLEHLTLLESKEMLKKRMRVC